MFELEVFMSDPSIYNRERVGEYGLEVLFSGWAEFFIGYKLYPLVFFQFNNGLKYKFMYSFSAKLKKASCNTPNNSNPMILPQNIETNSSP